MKTFKIALKVIATILLIGLGLFGMSYAFDMINAASTLLNWGGPCVMIAIAALWIVLIPKVWAPKKEKEYTGYKGATA